MEDVYSSQSRLSAQLPGTPYSPSLPQGPYHLPPAHPPIPADRTRGEDKYLEQILRNPNLTCAGVLGKDVNIILWSASFYPSHEPKNKAVTNFKMISLWWAKMTPLFFCWKHFWLGAMFLSNAKYLIRSFPEKFKTQIEWSLGPYTDIKYGWVTEILPLSFLSFPLSLISLGYSQMPLRRVAR